MLQRPTLITGSVLLTAAMLTQPAMAECTGLEVDHFVGDYGNDVFRLYVTLDDPEDQVWMAGTSPTEPLEVRLLNGGMFYQNAFGADTPPSGLLTTVFPSLAFDTFVTIGHLVRRPKATSLSSGWPGFESDRLVGEPGDAYWTLSPAWAELGQPKAGRVLIGQFTAVPNANPGIYASLVIGGFSNGQPFQKSASLLLADGCEIVIDDCNGNGIDDACEIQYEISTDVNGNGVPDACECPADLTDDLHVGIDDLLVMLGQWGLCDGCPADLLPDGVVNASDLLALLGAWGDCGG